MTLTLYEIYVRHPRTKETLLFLGQGDTVAEAVAEGFKNTREPFRPRIGVSQAEPVLNVTRADGTIVPKTLKEFESGGAAAAKPEPEDLGGVFG